MPALSRLTAVALLVLAADTLSKLLVVGFAPDWVSYNDAPVSAVLLAISVLASVTLALTVRSAWASLGVGLVAGGALGNGLGRLLVGPVPDFIPAPDGWVINGADVALITGAVVLVSWATVEIVRWALRATVGTPVVNNPRGIRPQTPCNAPRGADFGPMSTGAPLGDKPKKEESEKESGAES